MTNDIISGISLALNGAFGSGYHIYQQDISQGMQEPCFLITVLEPSVQRLQKCRFLCRTPFDLLFFPTDVGDNAGMISTADGMAAALENITLTSGVILRGSDMRFSIQDGVLHFFVNFDSTIVRDETESTMTTMQFTGGIKHG